jgi:hypothetical protein
MTSFSPQKIGWTPPSPDQIPQNWRQTRRGIDGAHYVSRTKLSVIISCCIEADGNHWVHLSVSRRDRLPTWQELNRVKEIFLGTESLALQVLVPRLR